MAYTQGQNQAGDKPKPVENPMEQAKSTLEGAAKAEPLGDDLETLRSDLKSLREDVSQMMAGLKGTAGQKVKDLAHDLKESGEQVSMKVLDQVGKVKDKGGELAVQLEEQVRERPMMSLLVAFGAGLVLSRMMERR